MKFVQYSHWDQLPASAAALFAEAEETSLFLSRTWLQNLAANALDDGQRLLLACVVDGDTVLAMLPLRTGPDGSWHSLSTYYSSLFSVLGPDSAPQPLVDCLADGLAGLGFESLRLEPIAEDDPWLHRLQQALQARGFSTQRLFHFVNWSHTLHGDSFERYLAQRPSRLRNTIARKYRKLQREHDCTIRLFTDTDLDRALADYAAVFKASWKDGERFPCFVPALVYKSAAAGWLRLAILYIDSQPAAAQIWFVAQGKASIFRLAYDERWQPYSPGSILTHHLMAQVITEDRVASIDFLTGNEPYKQDWMSERRERWRLVFVREPDDAETNRPLARLRKWLS
jgi:hypothetical protein